MRCTSGGVYEPYNYLLACQVRVTVGDSGLCCCVCLLSFERGLTPLFGDRHRRSGSLSASELFLLLIFVFLFFLLSYILNSFTDTFTNTRRPSVPSDILQIISPPPQPTRTPTHQKTQQQEPPKHTHKQRPKRSLFSSYSSLFFF